MGYNSVTFGLPIHKVTKMRRPKVCFVVWTQGMTNFLHADKTLFVFTTDTLAETYMCDFERSDIIVKKHLWDELVDIFIPRNMEHVVVNYQDGEENRLRFPLGKD